MRVLLAEAHLTLCYSFTIFEVDLPLLTGEDHELFCDSRQPTYVVICDWLNVRGRKGLRKQQEVVQVDGSSGAPWWKANANLLYFMDNLKQVEFEVLKAMITKMAIFWVLVEVYQRFRGPCCLHHQDDDARTSETLVNFYQTTRCYNPEDNHLQFEVDLRRTLINN
jgi:hypothetical protein